MKISGKSLIKDAHVEIRTRFDVRVLFYVIDVFAFQTSPSFVTTLKNFKAMDGTSTKFTCRVTAKPSAKVNIRFPPFFLLSEWQKKMTEQQKDL